MLLPLSNLIGERVKLCVDGVQTAPGMCILKREGAVLYELANFSVDVCLQGACDEAVANRDMKIGEVLSKGANLPCFWLIRVCGRKRVQDVDLG